MTHLNPKITLKPLVVKEFHIHIDLDHQSSSLVNNDDGWSVTNYNKLRLESH